MIEYNGHDAFEFGAVGQVTAKIDARPPPPGQRSETIEALFTFQHLDQFHPEDRSKAVANTNQLLKQLAIDTQPSNLGGPSKPADASHRAGGGRAVEGTSEVMHVDIAAFARDAEETALAPAPVLSPVGQRNITEAKTPASRKRTSECLVCLLDAPSP